jgi:hypothetical protein
MGNAENTGKDGNRRGGIRSFIRASGSPWGPLALGAIVAALLIGCGRRDSGEAEARIGADTTLAFDGFYVEEKYYGELQAKRSIFAAKFPNGTLYLQIHGDSVVMDYSNHEGGSGVLIVDSGSGPHSEPLKSPGHGTMGAGPVVVRRIDSSVIEAWENGADAPSRFLKMPASTQTIESVYSALLLDGEYRCADKRLCEERVVIAGNAVTGLKGKTSMRIVMDWLDNMPQMDYLEFAGPDSTRMAYKVTEGGLELFGIDLPAACKSMEDYDCPLTEAKPGKRLLWLSRAQIRSAGAAAF